MNKVIVTGGAGFIGSILVKKLEELGVSEIIVVDNLGESSKWKNLVKKNFVLYQNKLDFIESLIMDELDFVPDAVFHLGACSSTTESDADYLFENNLEYSKILCAWALEHGSQFIYASSAATYGDGNNGFKDDLDTLRDLEPLNCYGFTKHLFDLWAKEQGIYDRVCGLKFFNVFGPNEYHKGPMLSMVYRGFHQVKETGSIKLFKSYREGYADGEQKRDFIYVKDVVDVMTQIAKNKITGLYNLGRGEAISWNTLANAIFKAMDKPTSIEYISMPDNLKGKYQYYTKADMSKLQSVLPYEFTNIEDSVADYVKEYLCSGKCL